jgi:hypothetical protein
MKKFWASAHVVKSPQLRSSPKGSNPDNVVAVGAGALVAVGLGVLVTIGVGEAVGGADAVGCWH